METTQRITDEYGKRIDDQRRKLQQTMDLLNEKQRKQRLTSSSSAPQCKRKWKMK